MAVFVMSVMLLPLVGLLSQGMRDTQATIDEVQAANLASEMVEQLDSVPFTSLPPYGPSAGVTLSSEAGTLADGVEMTPGSKAYFRLTPLPASFTRELTIVRVLATRREATATVKWKFKGFPRSLMMRRILVKDEILPTL